MIGCENRGNMGFDFGLYQNNSCQKVSYRWLLQIDRVSGVVGALPPLKAARPSLEFKEQQVAHLIQHLYYPILVDWKPITLTLYDNKKHNNPVFEWVRDIYDPRPGVDNEWGPIINGSTLFKRNATICIYDGCGVVIEKWRLENAWPQKVDWGELNMAESTFVTVDVTLRYDRAYVEGGDDAPPIFNSGPGGALPGTGGGPQGFGIQNPNDVVGNIA